MLDLHSTADPQCPSSMTQLTPPPLLLELQNASSVARQTQVLREIKNEIIGYELRKRSWIAAGIIPALAAILSTSRRSHGKRSSREMSEKNSQAKPRPARSFTADEDASYVEAAVIVGVLARSGSIFVSPILNGDLIGPMLALLTSGASSTALVQAILKTLTLVAERLPPADGQRWAEDQRLASLIYSKEYIEGLTGVVTQDPQSLEIARSVQLALQLIIKTCATDKQKDALVGKGVLEALADRIGSFIVSQGFVLPGAEKRLHEGKPTILPSPAPPGIKLVTLIHVTAIIIDTSKQRARQFLQAPAMTAVFPKPLPAFASVDVKKAPWGGATYLSGNAVPRYDPSNAIDALLPPISVKSSPCADRAGFPPLSSTVPLSRERSTFLSGSFMFGGEEFEDLQTDEDEHCVVAWLICLARKEEGLARLVAIKLLAVFLQHGLARRSRVVVFGLLLVPLVVRMLEKDYTLPDRNDEGDMDIITPRLIVKEEAPRVLATLVMDSRTLQRAAVDADAMKVLAQLLKESFNPAPPARPEVWSAERPAPVSSTSDTKLGDTCPSPIARHAMRHREALLKALASIAPFDDEYRKMMCDLGVVPCILDSLKPHPAVKSSPNGDVLGDGYLYGNPPATLQAACAAAQALTRSVSMLRTSLVDAGIAPPMFNLLNHQEVGVQIAATKVICNLAPDFSPMKEALVSYGVVKLLCTHAHSAHPVLRLDSLWALKHLAYNSKNDLKINIVQELNPKWIRHLMAVDPESIYPGSIIGQSITHGSGEPLVPRHADGTVDKAHAERPAFKAFNREMALIRMESRREDDPTRRTPKDDIDIQCQVFDLVRNLICGDGAAAMADYLFKEMNQKEFFSILTERLRPRHRAAPGSSNGKRNSSKLTPPPTEIVKSVLPILVHIVAAMPKLRSLLVSQTEMMKLIQSNFSHASYEVRQAAVHIAINLITHEDSQDKIECRRRAKELEKLGFADKAMSLKEDAHVDVKERAKTVIGLFNEYLR